MEVLREIASLCDQLPIIDNQLFKKDFYSVSGYEIELIYPCLMTIGCILTAN